MRIKDFPVLFVFPSFFSSHAFSNSGPQLIYIHICISFFISCHEQCYLFEFPSLAVILKHSIRFINSIPYPMADPSHPFASSLMMLILKRDSLHIPNANTFSSSLSSLCSLSQTLPSIYSDQLLHYDTGERPRFFPP